MYREDDMEHDCQTLLTSQIEFYSLTTVAMGLLALSSLLVEKMVAEVETPSNVAPPHILECSSQARKG